MLKRGYLKEHASLTSVIMRTLDILSILFSGIIAFIITRHSFYLPPSYKSAIAYAIVIGLIIYPSSGIYQVWRGSSERDEIKAIFVSWTSLFICLIGIAFFLKESDSYSRLWVIAWYVSGFFLWTFTRLTLRLILRKLRKKGYNQRSVAIIGTGNSAQQTATTLIKQRWTGLIINGFYTTESSSDHSVAAKDIKGNLDTLLDNINKGIIDQVWIALPSSEGANAHKIIKYLDATTVDIRLVPDILQMQLVNHSISLIDGLPVIDLCMTPMHGLNRIAKAIEDKLTATLILLLISPLMLVLAIIIKLTSEGPVFYRQERVGWNGKAFNMLKFRSMPVNNEQSGITWGNAKNKETTRIGQFIRKTSLDELPQFINVLKGDMSIVGPRPERSVFVSKFKHNIPGYMKKHKVKAGITGWAQINGWRGDTDLNKRVEYDLYYIENWSVWFDIKIIFLTVFKGFFNKNAY